MPTPLPEGQEIVVTHIHFKQQYHMDSMQMATDHYNIGITLQGHRRTITPAMSYSYQAGDVALAPPFLFHRTLAEFDEPYERIMIKFSPNIDISHTNNTIVSISGFMSFPFTKVRERVGISPFSYTLHNPEVPAPTPAPHS